MLRYFYSLQCVNYKNYMLTGGIMKAIMVMFDSLNKHMLPDHGCDWIHAPNFERLAKETIAFDSCYAGSLPCIPARRELHTGRYNFLHRSWGPLEPFDDSMVELLKNNGVYTHLTTDHGHYFEDGGATYHTRYNSWEFSRGQEGDPWKGSVKDPEIPPSVSGEKVGNLLRQDWVNRQYTSEEENHPQAVTFQRGIEFIEKNYEQDRWFLQIEAFDPHEPFFTPQKYKDLYPHNYEGDHFDWPDYGMVKESESEQEHAKFEYAALVSMCDEYLGKVLDKFDQYNLWEDTLLIVNTDHGFMLGEKNWWGKNIQPFYNEIANIPLYIWDPRFKVKGKRTSSLVQTIDLAPTLLEYFQMPIPDDMQGKPLRDIIDSNKEIRKGALFGMHGGHVNCTDGRYVYMRAPVTLKNEPLFEYTLMPAHMHHLFTTEELQDIRLAEPFTFTKNIKLLKIKANSLINPYARGSLLFDLKNDPDQLEYVNDIKVERKMSELLRDLMIESDAPIEQYERLGLKKEASVTEKELKEQKKEREMLMDELTLKISNQWEDQTKMKYVALVSLVPLSSDVLCNMLKKYIINKNFAKVTNELLVSFIKEHFSEYSDNLLKLIEWSIHK